jgi:hypothetical protein
MKAVATELPMLFTACVSRQDAVSVILYLSIFTAVIIFTLPVYTPGGDDIHTGTRHILQNDISDPDRRLYGYAAKSLNAVKDFPLRNIFRGFYVDHRYFSAGDMNGAGHDAGRIGHFLACVRIAAGAGISRYGNDFFAFHLYKKLTSYRTSDTG